jgi:hypothetical protein
VGVLWLVAFLLARGVFRPYNYVYTNNLRRRMMDDPFVSAYYLEWNPEQDTGSVTLKLSNGKEVTIKVTALGDMAGWSELVRQRPLYVASDGTLHTVTLGN